MFSSKNVSTMLSQKRRNKETGVYSFLKYQVKVYGNLISRIFKWREKEGLYIPQKHARRIRVCVDGGSTTSLPLQLPQIAASDKKFSAVPPSQRIHPFIIGARNWVNKPKGARTRTKSPRIFLALKGMKRIGGSQKVIYLWRLMKWSMVILVPFIDFPLKVSSSFSDDASKTLNVWPSMAMPKFVWLISKTPAFYHIDNNNWEQNTQSLPLFHHE